MPTQLDDIIATTRLTDYELRRVLSDASKEADRIIRSHSDDLRRGSKLRSMQISLAQVNVDMWQGVLDGTKVGIGDAFDASSDWMARYDANLFRGIGASSTHWQQSMLATSRAGLDAYVARVENGHTLSDRVYRQRALSRGYVDRAINNALLLGKSPKELADDVRKFISPSAPGGASYAAMRLGRTEVVNAYHHSANKRYQETPWVERVLWVLSGSHPRPDECNEYADSVHFRGGQAGEFKPIDVPAKPHPNCLCYTTPVGMSLDKFANNFNAGKYDNYINEQMGCYHG